jgi:hypothetical protein
MRYLKSRWTLLLFLGLVTLGLWVRPAPASVTTTCYGDTLYYDFYDDSTGGYRGYIRINHSPQCV